MCPLALKLQTKPKLKRQSLQRCIFLTDNNARLGIDRVKLHHFTERGHQITRVDADKSSGESVELIEAKSIK